MKPITADYELCKELYELGVRIDSYFWWIRHKPINSVPYLTLMAYETANKYFDDEDRNYIPAPQLHELLDVMPNVIGGEDLEYGIVGHFKRLIHEPTKNNWVFLYQNYGNRSFIIPYVNTDNLHDPNPTNAVIKTLIWLIKEELVEVEKINERLS